MLRRLYAGLCAVVLVSGLTAGIPAATAAPAVPVTAEPRGGDDLPGPGDVQRRKLRQQALAEVLKGKEVAERRGASTVTKTRRGGVDEYVELARESTDRIFVVLAEFGDRRHPSYPDVDTNPAIPGPVRFDGPRRDQIPEPDRRVDNTTIWQPDYDRRHYQDLYFSTAPGADSVANYYRKQSSGRFSVEGMVTDWTTVPYNEARYGRSNGFPCAGVVCANAFDLVTDAANAWYEGQRAAGRTPEQIRAQLATFDVWDRDDFDRDGDFNEPDGYLDHFQIVHAGADQADGDRVHGEDAIYSHSAYAFANTTTGPRGNRRGGTQIGDSGIWVGNYTIQPENGGISVFCREFAHDLGLPDLYDTNGGANNVSWWSPMAQQRVSGPGEVIGTRINDLDAWSKLQLGWLDYEVVVAGRTRTLELGPHEYNSAKAQGVVVVLPDKQKKFHYGQPLAGLNQWWSTKGNNLSTTMTRPIDLTGKTTASLTLKARFDIQPDFDFLYTQVSTDGGVTWTSLDGIAGGAPFQRDFGGQPGLSSSSGGNWVDMTVPLDAVAGKKALVRFQYRTDGALARNGFFADEISIVGDGAPLLTDGAENGANGWQLDGFRTAGGTETRSFDNFYLASNRTYESYGQYLRTGPYNFGFPDRPAFVEHFPYQTGLVVSYWDTSEMDNNTSEHLGSGLILPIDAHPAPIYNIEGVPWRSRIAGYDMPFSLRKADSFTLHVNGKPSYIRGQNAVPLFDDTGTFLFPEQPNAGVLLPATGTTIRVLSQHGTSMRIRVDLK
ncbi:protease [Amycolatopsis sp. WAC 04197]|uniref:immune inhibitor A domain-containing protein n=1 Tax=Amycolatopsis sp. WAC 04197 TaxID=2203199 RepID=UPI000F7A3F70|nr:immune inhibitor A domain-containing protein [Amycolatopsis sp. WAC 04197]RSN46093.1 protease [Amycolatopsis sp. WAC 04197]